MAGESLLRARARGPPGTPKTSECSETLTRKPYSVTRKP